MTFNEPAEGSPIELGNRRRNRRFEGNLVGRASIQRLETEEMAEGLGVVCIDCAIELVDEILEVPLRLTPFIVDSQPCQRAARRDGPTVTSAQATLNVCLSPWLPETAGGVAAR